jgi:hypothetical protein
VPTQYQNPGVGTSGQPQPTPRRAGTLPPAYEDDLCNPRTCRRHDHGTGWDDSSWGGRRPVRRSPRLQGRYSCLSGGDSGDDLDASYHRGRDEVQFPGSASGGRYKATAPARDSKSPPTPEELQERLNNITRWEYSEVRQYRERDSEKQVQWEKRCFTNQVYLI